MGIAASRPRWNLKSAIIAASEWDNTKLEDFLAFVKAEPNGRLTQWGLLHKFMDGLPVSDARGQTPAPGEPVGSISGVDCAIGLILCNAHLTPCEKIAMGADFFADITTTIIQPEGVRNLLAVAGRVMHVVLASDHFDAHGKPIHQAEIALDCSAAVHSSAAQRWALRFGEKNVSLTGPPMTVEEVVSLVAGDPDVHSVLDNMSNAQDEEEQENEYEELECEVTNIRFSQAIVDEDDASLVLEEEEIPVKPVRRSSVGEVTTNRVKKAFHTSRMKTMGFELFKSGESSTRQNLVSPAPLDSLHESDDREPGSPKHKIQALSLGTTIIHQKPAHIHGPHFEMKRRLRLLRKVIQHRAVNLSTIISPVSSPFASSSIYPPPTHPDLLLPTGDDTLSNIWSRAVTELSYVKRERIIPDSVSGMGNHKVLDVPLPPPYLVLCVRSVYMEESCYYAAAVAEKKSTRLALNGAGLAPGVSPHAAMQSWNKLGRGCKDAQSLRQAIGQGERQLLDLMDTLSVPASHWRLWKRLRAWRLRLGGANDFLGFFCSEDGAFSEKANDLRTDIQQMIAATDKRLEQLHPDSGGGTHANRARNLLQEARVLVSGIHFGKQVLRIRQKCSDDDDFEKNVHAKQLLWYADGLARSADARVASKICSAQKRRLRCAEGALAALRALRHRTPCWFEFLRVDAEAGNIFPFSYSPPAWGDVAKGLYQVSPGAYIEPIPEINSTEESLLNEYKRGAAATNSFRLASDLLTGMPGSEYAMEWFHSQLGVMQRNQKTIDIPQNKPHYKRRPAPSSEAIARESHKIGNVSSGALAPLSSNWDLCIKRRTVLTNLVGDDSDLIPGDFKDYMYGHLIESGAMLVLDLVRGFSKAYDLVVKWYALIDATDNVIQTVEVQEFEIQLEHLDEIMPMRYWDIPEDLDSDFESSDEQQDAEDAPATTDEPGASRSLSARFSRRSTNYFGSDPVIIAWKKFGRAFIRYHCATSGVDAKQPPIEKEVYYRAKRFFLERFWLLEASNGGSNPWSQKLRELRIAGLQACVDELGSLEPSTGYENIQSRPNSPQSPRSPNRGRQVAMAAAVATAVSNITASAPRFHSLIPMSTTMFKVRPEDRMSKRKSTMGRKSLKSPFQQAPIKAGADGVPSFANPLDRSVQMFAILF